MNNPFKILIRKHIATHFPSTPFEEKEELYKWVTDAPFYCWPLRLWALRFQRIKLYTKDDIIQWVVNPATRAEKWPTWDNSPDWPAKIARKSTKKQSSSQHHYTS